MDAALAAHSLAAGALAAEHQASSIRDEHSLGKVIG